MKHYVLLFVIFISSLLNAQWVQSSLNSNIGRTLYSNGTTIYAGTVQGLYYTNDLGNPWISISPPEDVMSIITIGSKIIAGVGSSDGVYTSTDNGLNWIQATGLNGAVNALVKKDEYLFAGTWGGIGGVFKSSDDGDSWQPAGLANIAITDLLVVGNTIYAASPGANSKIYFSTNNGVNWSMGSLPYPASNIRSIYSDGTTLYACDAGLYTSSDMGSTWQLKYGITFDSTGYITDIMLFRSILKYNGYLIASVDFESFYISSDDGVNWNPFNDGVMADWTFVDIAINGSYIWGIRDFFGNAYRRPLTDIITSIDETQNTVENFLLLQNYPNPFNPSTVISYNLPMISQVSLKVYDVLGREIATLVNEEQFPGDYKVTFSVSGELSGIKPLSSGVYFYRLIAGSLIETKKLMLLK